MAGLAAYYSKAKGGIGNINPKEMAQLGEDWALAGVTGLVLGLTSASIGGLDKNIAGFQIPIDGAASIISGIVGLSSGSQELRTASIAAAGSASTRTFEKFFKKALNVHGEDDDGFYDQLPPGYGADYGALEEDNDYGYTGHGFGFGNESADPLLAAARHL